MEKLKAYHLTESDQNQAAIIFGRFNPPHFGHKAAWEIASTFPIWYVGTNQSTQGPKDPLPFNIKVEAMKTFMPELEGHLVAEQSWFTLASMVYKKHGAVVLHIVTDATDSKIFVPALQKQNGVEGPHGFYHFKNILWTEAKRQSEASLVRKAIKENNPQDFEKYSGVPPDTMIAGHPYFKLVRHYMLPYMQAEADKEQQKAERERLKAEKEKQKAEKAAMKQQPKTKGPAQELAEMKQRLDPKCWKGKHKEGTKIKGGVRVNNCVPNESINERSTSEKQARTMAAAAHDPKFAKKLGIKQSVAKEFNQADKGTKQLSNAMKHKRVSEALEEIYEAKSRGAISKVDKDAIPNLTRYDQLNNSDSYASYRFGVALAPSPDFTDMDRKSAIANSFAMVDYTEADAKIRRGAEKTMGVKSNSSTGKGSIEANDVNKTSPVAKLKRNKYGI